jgi:hypothetical protein
MSMKAIGIIFLASFSLNGCATFNELKRPTEKSSLGVELGDEKTYSFKKQLPDGSNISESSILQEIVEDMYPLSNVPKKSERASLPGKGGLVEINDATPRIEIKGLSIVNNPASKLIVISYENGKRAVETNKVYITKASAVFPYEISDRGDKFVVAIKPAKTIEKEANGLVFMQDQLLSDSDLKADLMRIYSRLNPRIDLVKRVEGEIDVSYAEDAVKANFERKYRKNRDKADGYSQYGVDGSDVDLKVFPYRKGSKLVYKFDVPYSIRGDGTTDFNEKNVRGLIAKIEAVAND